MSAPGRLKGQPIRSDRATFFEPFVIRDAVADDSDRIAALHSKVWRKTYASLAPPVMFEVSRDEDRQDHWRSVLTPNDKEAPSQTVVVAASADTIAGFISVGPPRASVFGSRGEIKQLYVDQTAQRSGLGRRLLSAGARQLQTQGYASVGLAVVEGNNPALRFYKAAGGEDIGGFIDPGPLWPSKNRLMAWDRISNLILITRA